MDLTEPELRAYRITTDEPNDLDGWWAARLERARSLAGPVTVDRYFPDVYGELSVYDVTFSGAGGERISGWYLRPAGSAGRRLPVVVSFPGYDRGRGLPVEHTLLPAVGFAQFVMDVRGQGRGSNGSGEPHVLVRGVHDRDGYYYSRVYVDAARAVESVAELPGADPDLIAVEGGSQGGGLALAVAALCGEMVKVCQAEVPMLCDIHRAITVSQIPPYREITTFLASHAELAATALNTLRYIDCALLARRITASCLLSVGLRDQLCPPSTVYAAYHEIRAPKELAVAARGDHRVPKNHTERKVSHLRTNLTAARVPA